jgi:hypothetical protein
MCDHCGCHEYAEIAELAGEHERILELAWQAAEHHDDAARAELAALLALHVAKEEVGLYPRLLAVGGLEPEVVSTLEAEHTVIDAQVATPGWDRRAFYALAAHIEEEEMELFPAAMFGFDDGDWAALADAYRAVSGAALVTADGP